jgi:hypothetical protein
MREHFMHALVGIAFLLALHANPPTHTDNTLHCALPLTGDLTYCTNGNWTPTPQQVQWSLKNHWWQMPNPIYSCRYTEINYCVPGEE